ncbi:MAG TPA: DUF2167 domain-containing protein [Myxococcota bacterium]|nr:DUF2167 domain-containing protein [Myxococcota bacterium]
MRRTLRLVTLCAALLPICALAQEEPAETAEAAAEATAEAEPEADAPGLPWQRGPLLAPIGGNLAEIELPEGYVFLDRAGTLELLRMTGNLTGDSEMAAFAKGDEESSWFVIFEWDDSGWVDDSDRDELDADALLASLKENDQAANAEREKLGLPQLELVGWHEPPHYDANTQNLTWATKLRSEDGVTVNRLIKLLGRRGVMSATLVASPEELAAAQVEVDQLLAGYRFQQGNSYAEYIPGTDKAAGYGLGALVVGGVLAKTGILAKFWKLIVVGAVAAAGAVKRLFGGKASDAPAA